MQRKTLLRSTVALTLGALLVPLAVHAQTVKLTLGHGAAPGNPRHEAAHVGSGERIARRPDARAL